MNIKTSRHAVEAYAEARGLSSTTAKDELLRVVAGARESATNPGRYRYRSRADDLDVTIWIVGERVEDLTVRRYNTRRADGTSKRGGKHEREKNQAREAAEEAADDFADEHPDAAPSDEWARAAYARAAEQLKWTWVNYEFFWSIFSDEVKQS